MIFDVDKFASEAKAMKSEYAKTKDFDLLQKELGRLTDEYKDCCGSADYLISLADELINEKDFDAGLLINKTVLDNFAWIADDVTLYLRLAQCYFEKGDEKTGTEYLVLLCTETADNYEEAISFRELDGVWQEYKHLVENKVPDSLVTISKALSPEECSMQIGEILNLSEDDMIFELYYHLCERSADGEEMSRLNKTEKNIFYAVEFIEKMNTEGLDAYLYENGNHFYSLKKAVEAVGMQAAVSFLDTVGLCFPRKSVPKKLESIQNAVDKLEEKGIDFEKEYDFYMENINNELIKITTQYTLDNKEKLS